MKYIKLFEDHLDLMDFIDEEDCHEMPYPMVSYCKNDTQSPGGIIEGNHLHYNPIPGNVIKAKLRVTSDDDLKQLLISGDTGLDYLIIDGNRVEYDELETQLNQTRGGIDEYLRYWTFSEGEHEIDYVLNHENFCPGNIHCNICGTKIYEMILPEGTLAIVSRRFYNQFLEYIYIPDTVEYIEDGIFGCNYPEDPLRQDCKDKIDSINPNAFYCPK